MCDYLNTAGFSFGFFAGRARLIVSQSRNRIVPFAYQMLFWAGVGRKAIDYPPEVDDKCGHWDVTDEMGCTADRHTVLMDA